MPAKAKDPLTKLQKADLIKLANKQAKRIEELEAAQFKVVPLVALRQAP